MKQFYFNYNGKTYRRGTVLKIKPRKGGYKYLYTVEEATFEWYNPDKEQYHVNIADCGTLMPKEYFYDMLIEPTDKIDPKYIYNEDDDIEYVGVTFKQELNIDGMLAAWIWYVFLMGVTLLFVGFPLWWAFISFVFFSYRNEKLRKAGYK